MEKEFIEAIAGILEANEYFLRSITEEFVRLNINITTLLYWSVNE